MAKDHPRLGRGLASLISSDLRLSDPEQLRPEQTTSNTGPKPPIDKTDAVRVLVLSLDLIRTNPMQPRRVFDEVELDRLAYSIREKGTLQPIVVRPAHAGYELVAGERRLLAARLAGIRELPAIVRSTPDDEMLELALIENTQRTDLNPIERARAYHSLSEKHHLTQEQIAARTGDDRTTIANYMRLLSLHEELQRSVSDGSLTTGHAKALLGLTDQSVQLQIGRRVIEGKWSVRQTEVAVAKAKAPAGLPRPESDARPAVRDLEKRLAESLGTRIRIQEGRKKHSGRIVIEYYNLDEFERITGRLGVAGERT